MRSSDFQAVIMQCIGLGPAAGMAVLIWPFPSTVPAAVTSCTSSQQSKMMFPSLFQLKLPEEDVPISALAAGGSTYSAAEFDSSGPESITEVNLGIKCPDSQPKGRSSLLCSYKGRVVWLCGL